MPIVISGTNGISGVDGTASSPALEGTDANTGVFFPAADTVAIGTGGTERLRVDSAGNAGLGVTPSAWGTLKGFQVGFANFSGVVGSQGMWLSSNAFYNGSNWIYQSNSFATFSNQQNGAHTWHIAPSGTAGNAITFTQAMTLDASGLLAIGRTTAYDSNALLTLEKSGVAASVVNSTTNTVTLVNVANGTSSVAYSGTATNHPYYFITNNSERARITSDGNLCIGTTTQLNSVNGPGLTIDSGNREAIVAKSSGGATYSPLVLWNTATSGNNYFAYFTTEGGAYPGTNRGSIDYNRGAGLTRYNTTSDATLKNIIGDSDGQKSIEILNTTRIREFSWKDDEQQKPQIGVIAQELYETFKGAVSVGGDIEKTDEEGNATIEYRPWGVDKTAFTFHLIAGWQAHEKMIKEQQAMINELKAKVAALESA